MRALLVATRFLTRLPVPRMRDPQRPDLGAAAAWFPCVGALIGLVVAVIHGWMTGLDSWMGALAAMLAWIWITGGLHIDGAADLADALGARHRRADRFLAVLEDPHVGTFGVLAIVCIILMKVVCLHALADHPATGATLVLIPAWARYGAVVWSRTLRPLAGGTGERFGWTVKSSVLWGWGLALTCVSALSTPGVLIAAVLIAAWWIFLRLHVGGMNGDALGAGIEWCEAGSLMAAAAVHAAFPAV